MDDCATSGLRFETPTNLALEVAFDDGPLTSDGGLTWLAKIDEELSACAKPWQNTCRIGAKVRSGTRCGRSSGSASFR